ncbi:MAG: periplasmic heavy metal sensor [Alphaproteobacteria bacterium]|nr:periplasmic heavy metal sensor [Alphaproteobacteria bacterium]
MTRSEKWLLAGLGVSLALNGMLAAMVLFHPGRPWHPGPDIRMGRIEQHLDDASRKALRESMESRRDRLRGEFVAMRGIREDIAAALTADPMDRAALEAAFAKLRQQRDAVQQTIQESFIEAAAKLPLEERVKLARGGDRYVHRLFGPGHGDGDRRGPGDDGRPPPPDPVP